MPSGRRAATDSSPCRRRLWRFQWSTQARYFTPLPLAFFSGCLVVTNRAFDPLPSELQRIVRAAGAKLRARLEVVGREQDEALLDGLLERQGLKQISVDDTFRSQFIEAAERAQARLPEQQVSGSLTREVTGWLRRYRLEHPPTRSR